MILRDYQIRALEALRSHWREPQILVAPTGAGKTVIAGALLAKSGGLVIAHTRTIVHQTARRLNAGVLMASETPNGEPVTCASIQTLSRRDRPSVKVVIIDEAHRSAANSYRDIVAAYIQDGACVIGLTATPCRLGGQPLAVAGWKRIVEPVTYEELFASVVLVRPTIYAPTTPNLDGVHTANGEYVATDTAKRVIVGDVAEHYPPGSRALAFAVNVEHSKALRDAYRARGIRAEHLDASDGQERRDAVLAALEAEPGVVTNCGLFGEGYDLPCLDVVVLARPTLSLALYRQQCGRVMRSFEGKTAARIYDHAGNTLRHGWPWNPVAWSLSGKPKQEPAAPVRWCPKCFAAYRDPPCPCCGYDPPVLPADPIEHEAGTLQELQLCALTPDDVRRLVMPCTADELVYAYSLRKALVHGYREGWATGVYARRTGSWTPPSRIRRIILEAWNLMTQKAKSSAPSSAP